KAVSNLSTVRGLAPEEPSKRGTYYSAAVARYGANHKMGGNKFVRTYAVAMASPLPKFEFPVGNGRVSLVPFAKSVHGFSISATSNFQPTNQIIDFYVQRIANMAGSSGADYDATINGGRPYAEFRINYEDVEQGADHDMDAIVLYTISVNAKNQLAVTLKSEYSAGSMDQHMGYVISGTTQDGVYLEVCDLADGHSNDGTRSSCAGQQAYKLNTP
ncbi:MAG TPA: pilus assembly protein, partial [Xylella taiwanensis]